MTDPRLQEIAERAETDYVGMRESYVLGGPRRLMQTVERQAEDIRICLTEIKARDALIAERDARIADLEKQLAEARKFPKLTTAMIEAACKAHYGSDNIHGISMTSRGVDWNFIQAFRRMWKGAAIAWAAGVGK